MLRDKQLALGALRGVIYDFEQAGDELPRHTHTSADVHISICAKGSFKIVGDGWEQTMPTGQVLDFSPGVFHAFVALEDGSRLVNIIKGEAAGR